MVNPKLVKVEEAVVEVAMRMALATWGASTPPAWVEVAEEVATR